jgi:hypothetical protein
MKKGLLLLSFLIAAAIGCKTPYYYDDTLKVGEKYLYSHQWENPVTTIIPVDTVTIVNLGTDYEGHRFVTYKRNSAVITVPIGFFRRSAVPVNIE